MERLTYRPVAHDDLDLFAVFLADPECVRHLIVPRVHSRAESSTLLDRWVAQHDGTIGMYTVLAGDDTVGWVGYVNRTLHWGDEVELGWSIRKEPHQVGGKAVSKILDWIWNETSLCDRPSNPDAVYKDVVQLMAKR